MTRKLLLTAFATLACLLSSMSAVAQEAYACYTPSNTTLTFYYDNQRASRSGTTYDLNEGENYPGWIDDGLWGGYVTRVVFNSSFAKARPTSTYYWFGLMDELQSITGLYYLNTTEVTTMESMFGQCENLTFLDVSRFATAKVTNMRSMFSGCSKLQNLDLSSFNTANVTDMTHMFSGCSQLTTVEVSRDWNTEAVTSSTNMFLGCTNIRGEKGTTYDASHVNKTYARIDKGTNGRGYLTTGRLAYACFTPSNSTLTFYFDKQSESRSGSVYYPGYYLPWPEAPYEYPNWYPCQGDVYQVVFDSSFAGYYPTDTHNWFWDMSNLVSFIDLKYLNTSQVTTMNLMFYGCSGLTSLDLSSFNTANVTSMYTMFKDCSSLRSLDLSSFNTEHVTSMMYLFAGCSGLTSLDLSSFNTANVTDMEEMFAGCSGLTSLNLSGFNTAELYNMRAMFSGCTALPRLDLSSFNTADVTCMVETFKDCSNLVAIYAGSGWSTARVHSSTDMFLNCTKLVGGQGTAYSASHVDAAYAHLDGGTSNPGYLSDGLALAPYAEYTSGNNTLTFYYDSYRSSRTGTTYSLNASGSYPAWYQDLTRNNVRQVVFDPSFADVRPTSTFSWFHGMTNLQSITGMTEYLNTSQVTDMRYMFCSCSSLTSIDVSNFNTSNATMINHMFYGCSGLTSLDLRNFNTANVTYMNAMFYGCSGLTTLNLFAFNTANVVQMNGMFHGCSGLTSLDLSVFNTAKVTNMNNMFQNCSNLETIYVRDGWSTARVNYSTDMFTGCTRIVGGQGTTYDASHVNKDYAHIDGGSGNPGYLTEKGIEAYAVFTSDDLTLTFYYDYMRGAREGDTYDLNTGTDNPGWGDNTVVFYFADQVVFDPSFADARPVSTYGWFWYMVSLRSITGIEYLNTTEVTNMGHMFDNCALSNIDLSHFNTANVTDMSYMFKDCNLLTSLDLSHFNTANVTDMSYMFYNCTGLTSLNMSNFNTAKVTDMKGMFTYCGDLTSLDVSHFNTARVTDMSRMFGVCSSLTSLDLSSFNTANVTNMYHMFAQSDNLRTIYVGNSWNTNAVTNSTSMFDGCTSLVGGKGTTYDANHVDKAYAHIDGGTSNPGYLTGKSKEAYACYTPSNTTLTFYYDNLRSTRTGTTYDLNTGNNLPVWYTDSTCYNVTTVVFNSSFASVRPTSTYCWFRGMGNLQSITGMTEYLNTSEVTMMWSMFSGCSNLTSLDVTNFNTANVTNLGALFFGCSSLANIDVSNFNTSQVTTLSDMFYGCSGLTSLDLSSFNTAHVGVMMNMFRDCSKLTTIYVGNEWSTDIVNYSNYMFTGCTRLVGGQGTTYNANHVDKAYAHIDGGPSNPGYFTDINAAVTPEAYACYTPSNTTLTFYYDSQRSTRTGTTYDLNTGSNIPVWYTDSTCYNVTKVVFNSSFASARPTSTYRWFSRMSKLTSITGLNYLNTSEVTNMSTMFYGCTKLTSLTLTGFNTANVRRMDYMFQNCTGLTSLDVSDFNTANVTAMNAMFSGCSALTSLDVSNFNTANVTTMSQMFYDCKKLTSLDVSSFNTANVTGMYIMFSGCSGLTSLDLSGFNTANVATLGSMFSGCSALTSLDVSDFNTANVTNMSQMFLGCKKLTNLDLSNFNTTNVTTMNRMFQGCSELTTVYVGDGWSTESVTTSTSMFLNCTSLVGGQGTTYDANHVDAAYAHIDGGTSNPGYFTAKFLLGDVNGDGVVNITDATVLINALLNENFSAVNLNAADVSGDGLVNITDATQLINRLLNSRKVKGTPALGVSQHAQMWGPTPRR